MTATTANSCFANSASNYLDAVWDVQGVSVGATSISNGGYNSACLSIHLSSYLSVFLFLDLWLLTQDVANSQNHRGSVDKSRAHAAVVICQTSSESLISPFACRCLHNANGTQCTVAAVATSCRWYRLHRRRTTFASPTRSLLGWATCI